MPDLLKFTPPELFMVFDVESVGLHGEGFAVGWVVLDRVGKVLGEATYACDPNRAAGDDAGRKWVAENVKTLYGWNASSPREVRGLFWDAWELTKKRSGVLVADCLWPVEARFVAACVDDEPESRTWNGPYPFHELASIRLAAGLNPTGDNDRLPGELPAHEPLADARQSARLLIEALTRLGGDR